MVLDAAEERGLDAGRLDARPLAVAPEAREELDEAVPPVRAAQQQRAARAEQRRRGVEDLSLIHISEPTRLLSISYAVFCLKKN